MKEFAIHELDTAADIDRTARFFAPDSPDQITIGEGASIGPNCLIFGPITIGDGATVEAQSYVGKQEVGYAVGEIRKTQILNTDIGNNVVLRSGSTIYAGCSIGDRTTIGHNAVIRTLVHIGTDSQLGHMVSVERGARLGNFVRCSPLSHLTSEFVADDRAFIGALVATINDRSMTQWKPETGARPLLNPPKVGRGGMVGSGTTLASGVQISPGAMVGSHSLVLNDVPEDAVVYGSPAKVRPERNQIDE